MNYKLVYQDIIDWLNEKEFANREEAESYMRLHQNGIIYPQQDEALSWYFAQTQEPQPEPQTPLEILQKGEIQAKEQELKSQQVEQRTIREQFFRLVRRLFGR